MCDLEPKDPEELRLIEALRQECPRFWQMTGSLSYSQHAEGVYRHLVDTWAPGNMACLYVELFEEGDLDVHHFVPTPAQLDYDLFALKKALT